MIGLETNIFSIRNIDQLSANYWLYRIKGLRSDQAEYYQNRQHLTDSLSRKLKSPILTLQRGDETYLVVREGVTALPDHFDLVRTRVQFEAASALLPVDFTLRSPDNDAICVRFLQFAVQTPLYNCQTLWQPDTGRPFFEYTPVRTSGGICHYRGYSVRVTTTQSGGLGIAVDMTSKFVGEVPMPVRLTRPEFAKWKQRHFIYHFGRNWYEIQAAALDDRTCSEYEFQDDKGVWMTLIDYALRASRKPIPRELAQITKDDAVLLYRNSQKSDRGAIAGLCYPVFGTDTDAESARFHSDTILLPYVRRRLIHQFAKTHLIHLTFGDRPLLVSPSPDTSDARIFQVPDQQFGHQKVVSTVGTPQAQQVSLDALGRTRSALLRDPAAGFYTQSLLDRQYVILPASVMQSYGEAFLDDLKRSVDNFYPPKGGYAPTVVVYDDRGKRTAVAQAKAIFQALEDNHIKPGYGLVMVHATSDLRKRQEDPLAGMVIRELRDRFDITAAVIHSDVPGDSYGEGRKADGTPIYVMDTDPKARGKIIGYLRLVALNKILLTNEKWPFVLSKRLHADITVGIDVKHHTVGIVVVSDGGRLIRPLIRTSRQKERLLRDQMRVYLLEVLRQEIPSQSGAVTTIVLHRDGRAYQSEQEGAADSIAILKREHTLTQDATLTILDIPKTAPARLRLFDVTTTNDKSWVENPQVGTYYVVNDTDGYICTTGRAFPHEGTVRPLHVHRAIGALPIDACLEDVYDLSTLAWSKPDDCSRNPITIKLCDRYLTEDATEYDADALVRAEMSEEEEVATDE